ncbi:MAG: ribbon-helix-helix domain-containing protein, partial [Nitrososphaerota archaeon]
LLTQSVIIPPELLKEVETFINQNKHLGYTSKEEFVRDAIRFRLQWLKDEYEYFEVPKVDIEKMNEIMETLNAPTNAIRYIRETIENAVKRVFDEYQSRKHELNEKVVEKLEDKLRTIEQYWETWRRQSK